MHSDQKLNVRTLIALAAVLTGLLLASGCASGSVQSDTPVASSEASLTAMFPATKPDPPKPPAPPSLKDPRTAVDSYLAWISYAYRTLDSAIASPTFDPYEEVRVDSYVMYNVQEGRAIDQRLLLSNVKSWESKGSTATVAMHEEWAYRYISVESVTYSSPINTVSYETTYTLVKSDGNWLVHSVEATAAVPPK